MRILAHFAESGAPLAGGSTDAVGAAEMARLAPGCLLEIHGPKDLCRRWGLGHGLLVLLCLLVFLGLLEPVFGLRNFGLRNFYLRHFGLLGLLGVLEIDLLGLVCLLGFLGLLGLLEVMGLLLLFLGLLESVMRLLEPIMGLPESIIRLL